MARMTAVHRYDADVATVYALLTDPEFLVQKDEALGAKDAKVESFDDRDGAPRIVSRRTVTLDLPGFAKRVLSPSNTLVQTDEWAPPSADGSRVCSYVVEVQGVPSRISGTLTLSPDGAGTREDIEAEVKVSVPLVGGKLERFAVDSGLKTLADEAAYIAGRLANR